MRGEEVLLQKGPAAKVCSNTSSDSLKVAIVPDSPKPSGASGGSDYGYTPPTPAFGAYHEGIKKADCFEGSAKAAGSFCHDVVSFIFKFGSNWTIFDVSTGCSVYGASVPKMVLGPFPTTILPYYKEQNEHAQKAKHERIPCL